MSFAEYKDFDKIARDAHTEGYETNYSLTVNAQGSSGLNLSTKTSYGAGISVFPALISAKYEHPGGFSLHNFECAGCNDVKVEASLNNLAPGLSLKLNSDHVHSASIGAVYKNKFATVGADFDILTHSSLKSTVLGGSNGILAGASGTFGVGKRFEVQDYSAAIGYAPNDALFVGLQANNKLSEFNASCFYQIQPKLSVSALVDYVPKDPSNGIKASIGAATNVADCMVKVKVNNDAKVNASVQREFPKKLTVNAAVEVDVHKLESYKFGVSASLG